MKLPRILRLSHDLREMTADRDDYRDMLDRRGAACDQRDRTIWQILEIHQPTAWIHGRSLDRPEIVCAECRTETGRMAPWPCATVQAITHEPTPDPENTTT
ncbi:hypothetical protein SEA_TARDUS_50 [Gordonia phage Tardus]|uniref:Uncharacterized protein n=1 Tax=Gordonia phage Tardus TaxID=2939734 RepID=A0A9E7E517_9CAUD|nr:hypothetical protein SEA_TARDUS_50 [Gordonia phage Tardus]